MSIGKPLNEGFPALFLLASNSLTKCKTCLRMQIPYSSLNDGRSLRDNLCKNPAGASVTGHLLFCII